MVRGRGEWEWKKECMEKKGRERKKLNESDKKKVDIRDKMKNKHELKDNKIEKYRNRDTKKIKILKKRL